MEPETIFKAMADRTRHRALALLHQHELTVSELVEVLHQPQSTVSRHLKILREAGLIRDRRDGARVLYTLVDQTNGGNGADLTARLLDWVAHDPVPPGLTRRLEGVMRRRRQMSEGFFRKLGRHWDTLREESFGVSFHLEGFLALLPAEWVVADVGTGTGYLLPPLANHFRQVIGVDPVPNMLEGARQRVELAGLDNVDLRGGHLSELPIEDESVDLAVAVLVLHHVPAPAQALKELRRILRKGGAILIVEQVAHESEVFRERMQDRWLGFEPAELSERLEGIGFQRVRSNALTTVERPADAPELFVVTGMK